MCRDRRFPHRRNFWETSKSSSPNGRNFSEVPPGDRPVVTIVLLRLIPPPPAFFHSTLRFLRNTTVLAGCLAVATTALLFHFGFPFPLAFCYFAAIVLFCTVFCFCARGSVAFCLLSLVALGSRIVCWGPPSKSPLRVTGNGWDASWCY